MQTLKEKIDRDNDALESEIQKATRLEREAQQLLQEKRIDEAFHAFDNAAMLYRRSGEHLKAAFCFASSATCWNIHTGWQPLQNAASRNHFAAKEALKAKQYDYARWLFREAALLYEKEGDYERYSKCHVAAKNAHVTHLWQIFFRGRKQEGMDIIGQTVSWSSRFRCLVKWMLGSISRFLWGHGERPMRTFLMVCGVVLGSAVLYYISGTIRIGQTVGPVHFKDALYFSVVTFTTLGYGYMTPAGWARLVAMVEAFSGIFLMPLFLIALTRKYLRIDR